MDWRHNDGVLFRGRLRPQVRKRFVIQEINAEPVLVDYEVGSERIGAPRLFSAEDWHFL